MSVPKTNQYKKQKAGTRNAGERKQASANHSIFGMIIGAALTVGGAYIADAMAGREANELLRKAKYSAQNPDGNPRRGLGRVMSEPPSDPDTRLLILPITFEPFDLPR